MELWQHAACELRQLVAARTVSAKEVVQASLQRINELDSSLHAFLTVMEEDALSQAEQVEARLRRGESLPLAGVPVAIKDNINYAGVRTTCGSRLLSNYISPYSATAVQRLKAAGAVVIGKTNMDEFAMGSSTEYSAYGPTLNPWDSRRVPGGSSGGSAAAVAAGMVPLALGSDTGGSVRQPASLCGVVGLKPTYGRVSRYGLIAFASSLDQIGPLARTVADTALIMSVLSEHDQLDATSARNAVDSIDLCSTDLTGVRFGVPSELLSSRKISPEVSGLVREAIDRLETLGSVVEPCSMAGLEESLAAYQIIASMEASSNLARYDGIRFGSCDDRDDQPLSYEERVMAVRSKGFGPEVKRRILLGTYLLSGEYVVLRRKAEQVRAQLRRQLAEIFTRYDLLLAPTSPSVAFPFGSRTQDQLSMHESDLLTIPANLAGIPAISIPCGLAGGLPVGLQLMGAHFSEPLLLRVANACEQAIGFPPLPHFPHSAAGPSRGSNDGI